MDYTFDNWAEGNKTVAMDDGSSHVVSGVTAGNYGQLFDTIDCYHAVDLELDRDNPYENLNTDFDKLKKADDWIWHKELIN